MISASAAKTHVGFGSNKIKPLVPQLCFSPTFGAAELTSCSSCFLLHAQLLPLEEDLQQCQREQQEAQQRCRQLERRLEELEEKNTSAAGERERHLKLLEARGSESAHGSHTSAAL